MALLDMMRRLRRFLSKTPKQAPAAHPSQVDELISLARRLPAEERRVIYEALNYLARLALFFATPKIFVKDPERPKIMRQRLRDALALIKSLKTGGL